MKKIIVAGIILLSLGVFGFFYFAKLKSEMPISKLSYYAELKDQCGNNSCCVSSVEAMALGNFKLAEEGKCPNKFNESALKCAQSYQWCEPEIDNLDQVEKAELTNQDDQKDKGEIEEFNESKNIIDKKTVEEGGKFSKKDNYDFSRFKLPEETMEELEKELHNNNNCDLYNERTYVSDSFKIQLENDLAISYEEFINRFNERCLNPVEKKLENVKFLKNEKISEDSKGRYLTYIKYFNDGSSKEDRAYLIKKENGWYIDLEKEYEKMKIDSNAWALFVEAYGAEFNDVHWETYSNKEGGYSFKYPKYRYSLSEQLDNGVTLGSHYDGSIDFNLRISDKTMIPSQFESISEYFDDFLSRQKNVQKVDDIAGEKTYKISFDDEEGNKENIYLIKDDKIYVFKFINNSEMLKLKTKILSSFKFE